jgi:hypothetical protein
MQRYRVFENSLICIRRPKSSTPLVVISCTVVINPERRVELFAREEVVVGRGTCAAQEVAEGIVIVAIYSVVKEHSPSRSEGIITGSFHEPLVFLAAEESRLILEIVENLHRFGIVVFDQFDL